MIKFQAQISTLTTQLKIQIIKWEAQLEQKNAELAKDRILRQLALERKGEHVTAMKTRVAEINKHRQTANLAYQAQQVEVERLGEEL